MSPPVRVTSVGVLGDIHAEDRRLACALTHLRGLSVDRVLAVGDIADGPGDFARTCELLQAADVDAVRGNHDRWLLAGTLRDLPDALPTDALTPAQRAYLSALPATRTYATPAGPLLLCHGLGDDDMRGVKPHDSGYEIDNNTALQRLIAAGAYRLVINGHTHQRMVRTFGALTIINAGTLLRVHEPCFAHCDFTSGSVQYFDLNENADGGFMAAPAGRHRLATLDG